MEKTVLTVILFLLCYSASALSIGAGPSSLEFLGVGKGGYAEKDLVVYTDSDEDLVIRIEATGPISEWLKFNETLIDLPAGGRKEIKSSIEPPITVPGGLYHGKIHFYAGLKKEVGNATVFPTKGGTSILATVKVTGEKQYSYQIDSISVRDIEVEYPIKINLTISNDGNIKLVPQISFQVFDETRQNTILIQNYSDSEVQPSTTRVIQVTLQNKTFEPGLYWVDVSWDLGGSQSISIEVLEKGALALYGKISDFELDKKTVQEDDTIRLDASFVNAGVEYIDKAILNVEVYSRSDTTSKIELKEVVESEPYSIPKNMEIELTAYYTPSKSGKYLIKGYIQYSGKKTRIKEHNIEVFEKPRNYIPHFILLGGVFILLSYYLTRKKQPRDPLDPATKAFRRNWGDYIQVE